MNVATPDIRLTRSHGTVIGRFTAMACPCEIIVETDVDSNGRELAAVAADEAWRVEAKFSRYVRGNIVDRINSAGGEPVEVDPETAHLLDYADNCHKLSGGLFDITSGVLRRVWRFDGSDRAPSPARVREILPLVGWNQVRWDGRRISLRPGMEIDLGGIGKEYAVDRALARMREDHAAAVLVNFGGDIATCGRRRDGRPWSVGIEGIDRDGTAAGVIYLTEGAVTTSGDSRKFVLINGRRFGHILDPRTGWPVENAPRSVTVAAKTCTEAGFLSTTGMLMGAKAESFFREIGVRAWCLREKSPTETR